VFAHSTSINSIFLHEIRSLRKSFPSVGLVNAQKDGTTTYNKILGQEDFIINDIVRKYKGHGSSDAFLRAGPRYDLHFDPTKVRAAIVTCGGLCPGLNNVIRELTHALHYLYHCDTVFGIR
jgi:6-phosphofructokinase 1